MDSQRWSHELFEYRNDTKSLARKYHPDKGGDPMLFKCFDEYRKQLKAWSPDWKDLVFSQMDTNLAFFGMLNVETQRETKRDIETWSGKLVLSTILQDLAAQFGMVQVVWDSERLREPTEWQDSCWNPEHWFPPISWTDYSLTYGFTETSLREYLTGVAEQMETIKDNLQAGKLCEEIYKPWSQKPNVEDCVHANYDWKAELMKLLNKQSGGCGSVYEWITKPNRWSEINFHIKQPPRTPLEQFEFDMLRLDTEPLIKRKKRVSTEEKIEKPEEKQDQKKERRIKRKKRNAVTSMTHLLGNTCIEDGKAQEQKSPKDPIQQDERLEQKDQSPEQIYQGLLAMRGAIPITDVIFHSCFCAQLLPLTNGEWYSEKACFRDALGIRSEHFQHLAKQNGTARLGPECGVERESKPLQWRVVSRELVRSFCKYCKLSNN